MTEHTTSPTSSLDGRVGTVRDTVTTRRRALRFLGAGALGGAGLAVLAACDPSSSGTTSPSTTTTVGGGATTTTAAAGGSLTPIPDETGGPFPADGTNGPNALTMDGVVRSDIRSSFGSYSGTAAGVPLTIRLRLLDAATSQPLEGAAVYLWHCDRDGHYSLYTVADQNYLRGVQAADASGDLSFTSIYPACYDGRWPHIHFEVYESVASATSGRNALVTSQLALPDAVNDAVYATSGYESSASNASRVSLTTDMVFRDGAELETPTVTGSVANGYVSSLTVAV